MSLNVTDINECIDSVTTCNENGINFIASINKSIDDIIICNENDIDFIADNQ